MEVELLDLWLPILVSTVVVYVASTIIWMMLPHHKADMRVVPDEAVMDRALNELKLEPGGYYVPNCSDKERFKTPEFKERWKNGPWAVITVPSGAPSFPKNLLVTFVEFLLIAIFVAYLASETLAAGADYLKVFQVVGTAAVLGHVFGKIHHEFFGMKTVRHVAMCILDGVVYALLTAGIFGWLWPALEGAANGAPASIPTP